ncbi:uncharacterized protein [Gossypium hirsutum]|uniref:Retrotransposon gag domain-containing protein n=1 Tax=Gossypium hirsutum TaxID=3635 RepID=A0A1U8M8L8_GOSHI|nr:uncharacterized protein LOC107934044 [Gossypium hirsutum]
MKPEINLQKPSVTIMPQQIQVGASIPMNFQANSGSKLVNNPNYLPVPDLDEVAEEEKGRLESQRQLEERCKWLKETFRAMESIDNHQGIDAKDLSLVLAPKFKMPEFEKYNGTSCPEAHITILCRRITGYVNNNQLLIHYFQDSLVGVASKWYNQLSRAKINSWKDLAQAFMKQYNHMTDMTPDRITLQNMEKKSNESFRQYAQRWREVDIQVQPQLLEKKTIMLFINTLKAPFITHMLGSATKSFSDIVMTGEMIENTVRSGKIESGESTRSLPRGKEIMKINKGRNKRIKNEVAEVMTSLRRVYEEMVKRGLITLDSRKESEEERNYCEFHNEVGHETQECVEFRALVQDMINNKEMEFHE